MTDTDHPRPMIENSDRGITLNKPLAWSILVTVAGLIWFGASTVASLQSTVENLAVALTRTETTIAADRISAGAIEVRVRALESMTARQDVRFDALSRSLDEVKAGQREMNELLRQVLQSSSSP